jgi:peptide/nickel transport system substrate-binding protein
MVRKLIIGFLILTLITVPMFAAACEDDVAPPDGEQEEEEEEEESKYGGTLKVATTIPMDINMGWPAEVTWMHAHTAPYQIFENLVRYIKADGTVEPFLAESWEFADDLSSITFYLRQGVKFHDGSDFKADSVKLMIDANIEAENTQALNWESADIIDDYTIRLNLKQFSNALWSNLVDRHCMIASAEAYNANGVEWMRTNPVGTGPFKFVEFNTTEVTCRLEKNPDYWQEVNPYVDAIEYAQVADQVTLEMMMQAGEIHVATLQPAKTMSEFRDLGFGVVSPLMGVNQMQFSDEPDEPWADVSVRQAIEYAIDKEAIADIIGWGIYQAMYQLCLPQDPWYDPDIVPREYDPDMAIQMLTDAGYGPDNPFPISLICDDERLDSATMVQPYLQAVGIDAEIEHVSRMVLTELQTSGWSGIMFGARAFRASWGASIMEMHYDPMYNSKIHPEGLEEMVLATMATPDLDEMIELIRQCLAVISEECPWIPLYGDSLGFIYSPIVHDGGFLEQGTEAMDYYPDNVWLSED